MVATKGVTTPDNTHSVPAEWNLYFSTLDFVDYKHYFFAPFCLLQTHSDILTTFKLQQEAGAPKKD